jgi:hypothetical protein
MPMMPTRVASGKSKPLRVGLRTEILRLRMLMDGIPFWGKGNVLTVREIASTNFVISFEA